MNAFEFAQKIGSFNEPGVYLLGVPYDGGCEVGRGARFAPSALRLYSKVNETFSIQQNLCLSDISSIFDLGDIKAAASLNDADAYLEIKKNFCNLTQNFAPESHCLITLGGDHSIAINPLSLYKSHFNKLNILHLDAHTDCIDDYMGKPHSNATVFRHVSKELNEDQHIYQYGIRAALKDEYNYVKNHPQIHIVESLADLEAMISSNNDPWYLSIDVDFFDPAFVPGTGCPVPGGQDYNTFLKIIEFFSLGQIVGADITELSPPLDKSSISTVFVGTLLKELVIKLANKGFK